MLFIKVIDKVVVVVYKGYKSKVLVVYKGYKSEWC